MRSHRLRAAGAGGLVLEDLRTELQKVGDAIYAGRTNYKVAPNYNIIYDQNEYYISDGGSDMFDNGNATYVMTENFPSTSMNWENVNFPAGPSSSTINSSNNLPYTQTTVATALGSSYVLNYKFVSGGYGTTSNPTSNSNHDTAGTLIMAATAGNYNSSSSMIIGFAHAGNLGADGSGSTTTRQLYNNATVDGFTVYAWDITTHGAGDPAVCNIYIFLGHPNWSTSFGSFNTDASGSTNWGGSKAVWSVGTQNNILAITALIAADNSSNHSNQHSTSQLTTIIDDIIADIKAEFGY